MNISFTDIAAQNNIDFPYEELLNCVEWKGVRKKILIRDKYECKKCKSSYVESIWNLHIHHTYYINDRLPWQYDETCFETLCWSCHKKLHQEQSVIVYVEIEGHLIKKLELVACHRCGSAGYFPQYSHVENGICFRCRGARFENLINPKRRSFNSYIHQSISF